MDIIALMGSPRKNSNTDILLDEMIKGSIDAGHNVTKYCVSDLNISACKACGTCTTGRNCVLDDDALKITHEIVQADGLIVSTPTNLFWSNDRRIKGFNRSFICRYKQSINKFVWKGYVNIYSFRS